MLKPKEALHFASIRPSNFALGRPEKGIPRPPVSVLSSLRVLLAGTVLLLPFAAFASGSSSHAGLTGAYRSCGSAKDPSLSVSLGPDGSATVTEDAGQGEVTLFGKWADEGDQIKITFGATEGAPAQPPMIFQASHDGLQAVTWDHAAWGKVSPPPLKKGYKVKDSYWLTTIR